MLYYLFNILQESGVPGVRLMEYITFRSGVAFVLALLLAIFMGRSIIDKLQKMQIGEIVRDLDLEGQLKKTGTPTMGGIIIIAAIMVPCLLVGKLTNVYMLLMMLATMWLGLIGFLDDYLKLRKHNKDGMKGKYKIIGQVGIAIIVAVTMYLNPSMVIVENSEVISAETNRVEEVIYEGESVKSPQTTIPFVKNNNFNYSWLTGWMGEGAETGGWIVFIIITIFLVSATSNGANLNDGLDGMTSGLSAIAGVSLAVMAYLGGHVIYSSYLNIMYVPGSEELVVYMAAFIGALIGFLWYNASPAQVFHGRHRQPHPRRRDSSVRNTHPQGTAPAYPLRALLHRRPLGNPSGGILQAHRRKAHLQDDATASPLPERRRHSAGLNPAPLACHSRAKNSYPLLDYRHNTCRYHLCNTKNTIIG